MKTTVIAATIALGLTAGVALADQPMVLTDAQLDRVTAGQGALASFVLVLSATGQELIVQLPAAAEISNAGWDIQRNKER